jgi:osmotically-inducible protein OsmY
MRTLLTALVAASLLSINPIHVYAQPSAKPQVTADQAKNNPSDRETMQKIRKALMDDKSLSTDAHNVKIIAQNGKVTLSGPVVSVEEKHTVEQKALAIAGGGNLVNEITLTLPHSKTKTGTK